MSSGFIGIGPPSISENDQICVLLGGTTPFALREDGQFWNFIGTAYVQGIMEVGNSATLLQLELADAHDQGEYVRKLESEGVWGSRLQEFTVR